MSTAAPEASSEQQRKDQALAAFRAKLLQHKVRVSCFIPCAPTRAARVLVWAGQPYTVCSSHARLHAVLQELDARVRALREEVKKTRKQFDKTEDDLKALQSVGQIIGEVLRQLDAERCTLSPGANTLRVC